MRDKMGIRNWLTHSLASTEVPAQLVGGHRESMVQGGSLVAKDFTGGKISEWREGLWQVH